MYKVLIVEDERILREAYREILTQEGFVVQESANGREALDTLRDFQPDLILLDILMPEMDGLSFLKAMRNLKSKPKQRAKIVAFSNLSDQQKLDEMINLGVSKNVLKSSLSPKQLVHLIRELLRSVTSVDQPA